MSCLVLTSDPSLAALLSRAAEDTDAGPVEVFADESSARAALQAGRHAIAFVERMGALDRGLKLLKRSAATPIVLVLDEGARHLGPRALELGAADWVRRESLDAERARRSIVATLERAELRRERERLRHRERREARARAIARPLRDTITELGVQIRTHLTCLLSESEELRLRFHELPSGSPDASPRDADEAFQGLHDGLADLADSVRSLLILTELLHRRAEPEELESLVRDVESVLGAAGAERLGLRHPAVRPSDGPR